MVQGAENMIAQCDSCKRYFDNEFRLTYCPHGTFAANDGNNNFVHHPESYLSEVPKRAQEVTDDGGLANSSG